MGAQRTGQASQFGFLGSLIASLGTPEETQGLGLPPVNLALLLVTYLVSLALVPFSIGLVQRAGIDIAFGQPSGFRSAVTGTLRSYWGLLAVAVLYALVSVLAITCILAPLVENYWCPGPSAYGREVSIPGVRNFRVVGPASFAGVLRPLRSDHLYIVRWYLRIVEDPRRAWSFDSSPIVTGTAQ